MRILLIEDEVRLAEFVRQGLHQADHYADVADNGAIGLKMAVTVSYDAILLDLMLPGQNGFEVLRNMREFGLSTPVIINALSGTEHVIGGLDAGALDYQRKPFEFDELLARRALTASTPKEASTAKLSLGLLSE